MTTVGQRIRKIRKQTKMNINQLGQSVGVSGSYIAKLETGERRFSLELLTKIAKQLDVSLASLLGPENEGMSASIPVFSDKDISTAWQEGMLSYGQAEFHMTLPHLKDREAFAVISNNSSASPCQYEAGDILIFSANSTCSTGDIVLGHTSSEFVLNHFAGNGTADTNGSSRPSAKLIGTISHYS